MHLEGKIHQGFLKLRTEIETLKIRLEIVQQKIDKEKGKEAKDAKDKDKEREKEKEREKPAPAPVALPVEPAPV
jgi:hypothetical protein